jgi:hypothetical protein
MNTADDPQSGDFAYPNFLADLQTIVDSGVRVGLFYGDAGMSILAIFPPAITNI